MDERYLLHMDATGRTHDQMALDDEMGMRAQCHEFDYVNCTGPDQDEPYDL